MKTEQTFGFLIQRRHPNHAFLGFDTLRKSRHVNSKLSVAITEPPPKKPLSDKDDDEVVVDHPLLQSINDSFRKLQTGSDIRGQFFDHETSGLSTRNIAKAMLQRPPGSPAPLSPFAAYCFGYSFANMVSPSAKSGENVVIGVGRDPRSHGVKLADSLCRGAAAAGAKVVFTDLATTPSMFEFCRSGRCDGAFMVTASHLPKDRNGLKMFTTTGGFTKTDVGELVKGAIDCARHMDTKEMLFLEDATIDDELIERVDFMPHYASTICDAIHCEICFGLDECDLSPIPLPLAGLRIVLNAGNGSGFFFKQILRDLGADVSFSLGCEPDGTFPNGVPNPESNDMVQTTIEACEGCNADIGVMLDTDADRSGFILPRIVNPDRCYGYEPLNRNRLIALLGVIFKDASPGCTIVTDSVTSEGLAKFLEEDLGLKHYRFVKGYANVIGKAKELTESGVANAEVAVETSGHCAMQENGYLDDGTYTAVKVIGLLARVARDRNSNDGDGHISLLDLISNMEELEEARELRLTIKDGSMETTTFIFDECAKVIKEECRNSPDLGWEMDKDNMEGVRFRTGEGGGFFMMRSSLHDPLLSLQVEGSSASEVKSKVIVPLLDLFRGNEIIGNALDLKGLEHY